MKLFRQQLLNVFYQVCVFRTHQQRQSPRHLSDRHIFGFFSSTSYHTNFDNTWTDQSTLHPPWSLCFSCWSVNKDGGPGLWFTDTSSTFPLQQLNRFRLKLTGSKNSKSSSKFVFLLVETFPLQWLNRIQRNSKRSKYSKAALSPWPLIGWRIFNLSKSAERIWLSWQETIIPRPLSFVFSGWCDNNDARHDFKSAEILLTSDKTLNQAKLDVFYQVGDLHAYPSAKMTTLASDWLISFRLFLCNC